MLTLVAGGAACGKSEYAEGLAMAHGGKRTYIATMKPYGTDAELRIARHRELRKNKGFCTIECYTGLNRLQIDGGLVLLECLGNLAANELFNPGAGYDAALQRVQSGLQALMRQADELIIVGNDICSDGIIYPDKTMEYIALIGQSTSWLASRCDRVAEVVCGIPLWLKGGEA